jgi:very-short-patch-repair endonuclease
MKKMSKIEFIEISSKIHNYKYNYSLVSLSNLSTNVKILCPIHGIFEQIPKLHKNGAGCPKCSYTTRYDSSRDTLTSFIEKANNIHSSKYSYDKVTYTNSSTKVDIICSKHGVFKQTPSHHLSGRGCNKCGNNIKSYDYFINESISKHGNHYDYSLVNFIDTKTKIKILCPVHGEFKQTPNHHYNGAGCPICRESKGEREIRNILLENGFIFKSQHRFNDCRDKKPLPFDFYLPELNLCIEYDGEQHYQIKDIWGGKDGLLDRQNKDFIKTKYCVLKKITLIRITGVINKNNLTKKLKKMKDQN